MHWLKSKVILFFIAVIWGSFIVLCLPLLILSRFFDDWTRDILMGQDYLVNAILGGDHETTVSSEIGNQAKNGSRTAQHVETVVNLLFKLAINQDNHCFVSIKKDDRHDYSAFRLLTGSLTYILTLYGLIII